MAASEGTFMIHGLAVLYARWQMPEAGKKDILPEMERKLSANVQADLDWLESELQAGNGKFLVGNHVTAADTMMGFSAQFILTRKLGTGDRRWPSIEAWLQNLESQASYKNAAEKTGHSL
jgi:glutathione S-transferase